MADPIADETLGVSSPPSPISPEPTRRLTGLQAGAFAHPYDRQAMAALARLRGFDFAVGKIVEWQHEHAAHVLHSASSVRVTSRQMAGIHHLLKHACSVLDMDEPEMYVASGRMNAFTSGHNRPYIVLTSDLVDAMTDAELQAVIAHELGHIKCRHVLYKEMVRWISQLGIAGASGSAGWAGRVQMILKLAAPALLNWDQKSELSADRAAMLVVQDEDVCIRMLLKLAGAPSRFTSELDTEAFLDQARHLQDLTFENAAADRHRRQLIAGSSHPLTVERARLLDMWIHSGEYEKVLADPPAAEVVLPPVEQPKSARRRHQLPRIKVTVQRSSAVPNPPAAVTGADTLDTTDLDVRTQAPDSPVI